MSDHKVTKSVFTLDRTNAKWLAEAALSAISKDDNTPIICAAQITVYGETVRITVTDRYRIHTTLLDTVSKAPKLEVIMPSSAITWLNKNIGVHGPDHSGLQRIVFTTKSDGALGITIFENAEDGADFVSWGGHVVKGNYPSVYKLIEAARVANSGQIGRVNLDFIEKANQLNRYRYNQIPPLLEFKEKEAGSKQIGVLYMAFGSPAGDDRAPYAEAIMQPQTPLNAPESRKK